ncbi:hypothetical protein DMA11_08225 [Marinilabiliaceae bacterium JC017]|nr:hypothetical protein DMA11_08225 [Marinilabiliaceae bacterium JC017]
MLRIIVLIGILNIFIFEAFTQNRTEKFLDDFSCLTPLMLTGIEVGSWDTLIMKSILEKECNEYLIRRKFQINEDTLSIIKTEDQSSGHFIGIKAVLQSDKTVLIYLYLKDSINGKTAKRLKKKKYYSESPQPLVIEFKKEGETHSVDFKSP